MEENKLVVSSNLISEDGEEKENNSELAENDINFQKETLSTYARKKEKIIYIQNKNLCKAEYLKTDRNCNNSSLEKVYTYNNNPLKDAVEKKALGLLEVKQPTQAAQLIKAVERVKSCKAYLASAVIYD
ncbi:hypothetical protein Zmor_012382 [Zophobas morio]|uniref:Uncharacterized protein n=1 Tax=Zophobas morio TaxID=2755281 RepID=A0AA38HHV9_9CUCU|nr:hypothetical protein Zmor_012382 [Zophobas morio]